MNTRRDFIRKAVCAGTGLALLPEIAEAAVNETAMANAKKVTLKKNSVILFQGDSITDCGRKRDNNVCNSQEQLGYGYALYTATSIMSRQAALQPKIYNKGVSGNKVYQLRERWETDTLALMPDVLSILIGVNDHWHTLAHGYKGTPEKYADDLRDLVKYTQSKLPKLQIVICEPFVLKGGSAIKNEAEWFPVFDEYRKAAKKIASDLKTFFVPFQSAFDEAVKKADATYWSRDGVHPDLPGRQLMAETWLKATGL